MSATVGESCVPADAGFTLAEMLVALLLTLLIVMAALWLLATDTALAESLPQAADLQQRGRLGLSLIAGDLSKAGAGPAYGRLAGGLARAFPAVLPRRVGLNGSDPFTAARADVVTVLWSPEPWRVTELSAPVAGATPSLSVTAAASCGGRPLCGLTEGTAVVIFDDTGRHGMYVLTAISGSIATLRSLQSSPPAFAAGAMVLPIESRTYVFDPAARQVRSYDGYLSDAVVVDDVVGMEVTYAGDGDPPARPKPQAGDANCLFDAAGTAVAALPVLPLAGESLAVLPLELFQDGPWCGEGDRRFDADLMRVRAVRISLRLNASLDQMRGSGLDFLRPGRNGRPLAAVPDLTLVTEVTPWNLNQGR